MGSSAKTRSTCLQLQAGCAEPAGGLAWGEGGEAPLTWHTKAPHTSGERRHLQVWGPLRARQWEIPAAPEPQTDPPPEAFSPPPAAPGAPRCLCLGAGEPQAGEGVSCWRLGLAVAPPREGGSPGAQRGFTHGARHSRPCPRPARSAAWPESLYVNEAQLAVCSAQRPRKGGGQGGGPSGIHITRQQSGRLIRNSQPHRRHCAPRAKPDIYSRAGRRPGAQWRRWPRARGHGDTRGRAGPERSAAPRDQASGQARPRAWGREPWAALACASPGTRLAGTKPGPPQALTPHSSKVRGWPRSRREERDAPAATKRSLGPLNRSHRSLGPFHVTARPL